MIAYFLTTMKIQIDDVKAMQFLEQAKYQSAIAFSYSLCLLIPVVLMMYYV